MVRWFEFISEDRFQLSSATPSDDGGSPNIKLAIDRAKTLGIRIQNNPKLKALFDQMPDESKKQWLAREFSKDPELEGLAIDDSMYQEIVQSGAFGNPEDEEGMAPQNQPEQPNPMDQVDAMATDAVKKDLKQ